MSEQIRFSMPVLFSFLRFMRWSLFAFAMLLGSMFAFAPQDWIALLQGTKTDFAIASIAARSNPIRYPPALLMISTEPVDALYLTFLGTFLLVVSVLALLSRCHAVRQKSQPLLGDCFTDLFTRRQDTVLMLVTIYVATGFFLLLHMFGNFHYQFYCAVGVIKTAAYCEWMANWATALASAAGLILSAAIVAACAGTAALLFFSGRACIRNFCCIKRQVTLKFLTEP